MFTLWYPHAVVIVVANEKGGTGKTTCGVGIAAALARPDVDLVICDTPPGLPAQLREAMKVADVILIPVRPSGPDFSALRSTLELIKILARAAVEVRIIVSQAMPGTVLARDARDAAAQYGAEVCRAVIYSRVAHATAATAGRPSFQYAPESLAAMEMDQLAREVRRDAHSHPA